MHITRMIEMWIKSDEDLEILAYQRDKRFGYYIGSYNETSLGCRRIRPLLTSQCIYNTEKEAIEAANALVQEIRQQGEKPDE